jgi:hypothetical protein
MQVSLNSVVERVILRLSVRSKINILRVLRIRPISTDTIAQSNMRHFTFDAFDTLFTRLVIDPHDVFSICSHYIRSHGLTASRWHALRTQGELAARKSAGNREITLSEIYDAIGKIDHELSIDLLHAKSVELEIESQIMRTIRSTSGIASTLSHTKSVAVLSDTYFTRDFLHNLFAKCEIDHSNIEIYASSETGKTKRSGELYSKYRSSVGTADTIISHTGDSFYADVYRAIRSRCRVMPFWDGFPNRFEIALSKSSIQPDLLRSALAGCARSARLQLATRTRQEHSLSVVSSGVTAPFLFSYVAWVIKRSQALGIARLYFLARDGEILVEIARRIIEHYSLKIEARYLYVSRQSLHLPAVDGLNDEDLRSLNFRGGLTFEQLLSKVGLSVDNDLVSRLRAAGYLGPCGAELLNGEGVKQLITALRSPDVLPFVASSANHARSTLLEYLAQEGLLKQGKFAVVDVGWRGRLQRSLCSCISRERPDFANRLHGFYLGLYDAPSDSGSFESYIDDPEIASLHPYVRGSLFEVFCTATHGTTIRYDRLEDSSTRPVLASATNEEAESWGLRTQQESVRAFTRDLLSVAGLAQIDLLAHAGDLSTAASLVIAKFVGEPTRGEAEALGSFPHAADQSHTGILEIAPPLPVSPLEWFRRLRNRGHAPLISYWPEGSIVRTFGTPVGLVVIRLLSRWRAQADRRCAKPAR